MSIWDDPDLRVGGEFVKFENPGDSVSGTVTAVRAHRFDDGSVAPQVLITTDSGEDRTVTAGQVRLKAELATQRPEPGDHVTITFTEIEKRSGGKTLKHFAVEVNRGGAAPAPVVTPASTPAAAPAVAPVAQPAPAAAQAPAPAVDAQAAAAAIANLTPEQRVALGLAS